MRSQKLQNVAEREPVETGTAAGQGQVLAGKARPSEIGVAGEVRGR